MGFGARPAVPLLIAHQPNCQASTPRRLPCDRLHPNRERGAPVPPRGRPRAGLPDIAAAERDLEPELVVNGELVVPHKGCLDFGLLQQRALRRGQGASQAAADHPAHMILFDVLEADGVSLVQRPYRPVVCRWAVGTLRATRGWWPHHPAGTQRVARAGRAPGTRESRPPLARRPLQRRMRHP
ncbi:hypothetical protein [Streptomyces sp. E11-3]|uniref:ATP-dependent DNA ligase n=1 Tax=Streptomyces sp. E11-3 TaxID=3110112 RepID=UPI00397FD779